MTTVALLLVLGLLGLVSPDAVGATPVCKSNGVVVPCGNVSTDFFEDFENQSPLCSGVWSCNDASKFSLATGTAALSGARSALITYPSSGYPATSNGGAWSDTGMTFDLSEGQKMWASFKVRWSPGFLWLHGDDSTWTCVINGTDFRGIPPCACCTNANTKFFEWEGPLAGGCQNRHLWTGLGQDAVNGVQATNDWSGLTNYPGCPHRVSAGVPDPGMTGPVGAGDMYDTQPLASGVTYNMVIEMKNSQVGQGHMKVWRNGVQVAGLSQLVTCSKAVTDATCRWNAVRYGGQFAGPIGTMTIDDIHISTEECLAPTGCAGSLNTPSNPKICRGAGCAPALLLPVPLLAAGALWLRRWLKRRRMTTEPD